MSKEQTENKKPIYKKWWFWVIIILILCIMFSGNNTSNNSNTQTSTNTINNNETNTTTANNITLLHGNLLDFKENSIDDKKVCIIKAKITSSYSNSSTINQNYYNIEDFIKNQNGNYYDEIQYWAVADMTSGEENKVISFTVDKNLISKIYNNQVVANTLGTYVTDLWILESLK